MNRTTFVLGITLLIAIGTVVGCRSPRRTATGGAGFQGGVTGGGAGGGGGGGGGVSADPRQALEQVEGYLTSQGYARSGPAVRNSNLPVNGVIAYGIDAQPQACYTAVALAQQGADLNMVVLDPSGRTIAYNVSPDAHPWATVCPGVAGRVIVRLQMAAGGGEYYYAVYQGGTATRPDLNALFEGGGGGGGGTAVAQSVPLDGTTGQRVTALDGTLGQEGFTRLGDPHGQQYREREDQYFALNLAQGTCYAFATFGGQGARDTDVFLVDGQGNEIERDVSPNVDAVVRFCPPQAGAYRLRTRMYGGAGPLFTVGYQQGAAPATQQQTQVIATSSTGGAGLDENFRLLDSDMRARGYETYGQPANGQLAQGETHDYPIQLEGGKCYAILAVGDNGVRDLDLTLLDARDETVDRDVETDARPVVRVCAPATGQYKMQVRMFSGQGSFIYAQYRWPRGTRGPFNLDGLIYVRLAEVTSLLAVEGYEPDVQATPGRGRIRREGQNGRHNIPLEAGQCYAILAVGGEGVSNLDLSLSSGGTAVASDTTRTAFPDVRYCPTSGGRVALQVTATGGSGEYFYQVFRRGAAAN